MKSLHFVYDGIPSTFEGIYLVKLEGGLTPEPFIPAKEIISETIPNNPIPYVYEHRDLPLEFPLTFSLLDESWTHEKRRKIASWIDNGRFNEFYSSDNPNKRYYITCIDASELYTNPEDCGYFTMRFKNISPYSYSPVMMERIIHDENTPKVYEFCNLGDVNLFPEMQIKKIGNGDLTIKNLSNNGKVFKFTNLLDGETLLVDNLHRDIETDIPSMNRYDNFNQDYLELVYGNNRLDIDGKCEIIFRYQFTIKG